MTVRRLKTYTGSQGYVYQYYFVGKRAANSGQAAEYVFDVTSDRKTTYAVGVFLPHPVVAAWDLAHGRTLTDSEQYAAVKMRLFRGFDEMEGIQAEGCEWEIDLPFLESALVALGVE